MENKCFDCKNKESVHEVSLATWDNPKHFCDECYKAFLSLLETLAKRDK